MLPPLELFITDACYEGGGGVYRNDWFYVNFKADYPQFANCHINCLELLTVFEGAKRWAPHWRGNHIKIFSDNSSTVAAINKGSSQSPQFMEILRNLFWLSVKFDFRLSACHIKGELNVITVMISRLHMPQMRKKCITWMSPVNNCVNCFHNMSQRSFLHLQVDAQG